MTGKGATGLFSAGILVGALALVLVQQIGQPGDSGAVADPEVPAGAGSTDQTAALRSEYEQHISALTAEKGALQTELDDLRNATAESRSNTPDSNPPRPPFTVEEVRKRHEEDQQRAAIAARKRKSELLLAAGYSIDQIEHLQRRSEELAAQFRQSKTDQLARGVWPLDPKKDLVLAAVIGLEPTFALKYEIGDAEYERYLAAQKRPTTVHVSGVSKGSIAEAAGIVPGDEIVTYDNERIFNSSQLQELSTPRSTDIPGKPVPMTVRRDGQVLQVMVPREQIMLSISQPLSDLLDGAVVRTPVRIP